MASQGLPAVSWVQLMFVSAQISEPPIPFGTGQSTHRIFFKNQCENVADSRQRRFVVYTHSSLPQTSGTAPTLFHVAVVSLYVFEQPSQDAQLERCSLYKTSRFWKLYKALNGLNVHLTWKQLPSSTDALQKTDKSRIQNVDRSVIFFLDLLWRPQEYFL